MSDNTQYDLEGTAPPGTRLSRRSLRERAAAMETERGVELETAPTAAAQFATGPVASVPVASVPVASSPIVGASSGYAPVAYVADNDATPIVGASEGASVTRVVRRSRRDYPPSHPTASEVYPQFGTAPAAVEAPVAPMAQTGDVREQRYPAPGYADQQVYAEQSYQAQINPAQSYSVAAPVITDLVAPDGSEVEIPDRIPWDAITTGRQLNTAEVAVATRGQRVKRHALRSDEAERVPPPSAGYTWLQYLILIAVAFVLGILLWQLVTGELHNPLDGGLHLNTGGPGITQIIENLNFMELQL